MKPTTVIRCHYCRQDMAPGLQWGLFVCVNPHCVARNVQTAHKPIAATTYVRKHWSQRTHGGKR